jgi:hypothetical protein
MPDGTAAPVKRPLLRPSRYFAALKVPLVLDAALMRKDDLLDDVETEAEAVIPDRRTAVTAASVTL